jgi:hypothetical protein
MEERAVACANGLIGCRDKMVSPHNDGSHSFLCLGTAYLHSEVIFGIVLAPMVESTALSS